jgi:hypothetical protein
MWGRSYLYNQDGIEKGADAYLGLDLKDMQLFLSKSYHFCLTKNILENASIYVSIIGGLLSFYAYNVI